MKTVAAVFFDGRSSRAHAVQVGADSVLHIRTCDWERSESLACVHVTPRVAGIHRTLTLPDGGLLQVDDNDAVDAWFPGRYRAAALIDRLERHSVAVAAALLITAISITGLIFWGIPAAAEKVANYVPESVARAMGEQAVALLDRFGFNESELPRKQSDHLRAVFTKYVADLPDPTHYQLRFMKANMANAFALPGGIIVVTDNMIKTIAGASDGKADDDDTPTDADDEEEAPDPSAKANAEAIDRSENAASSKTTEKATGNAARTVADERFLAVIAHEIGHEEHKHVLRSVLQNSSILLLAAYFTGDVSSASALVVSVPTFLLDSHYSRAFETDADDYAFASLAAHGISPARFAEVMMAMRRADSAYRHEAGYLSTHPETLTRIMNARAAADRFQSGRNR